MTTPDLPTPPPTMACGVCARVLNAWTDHEGILGYRHDRADEPVDHPAVPVPPGQIHVAGVCDFCSTPDPTWVLPVRTFAYTIRAVDTDGTDYPVNPGQLERNVGNWAACTRCARYITNGTWDILARYVARTRSPGYDPATVHTQRVAESLAGYYDLVRANMTGPPRPATPEDWT